uniref:Acyl-CoA thioesterase n=1 Tax=Steinernema glaseri TaxID=37863 RepID=A0A1I8A9D3_9BILA
MCSSQQLATPEQTTVLHRSTHISRPPSPSRRCLSTSEMETPLDPSLTRHWTNVEKVAEGTYQGKCVAPRADGRVFGGHVLAQSLAAAYDSAPEGFALDSTHCYFIRGGDEKVTIIYNVKTIRNGRSFAIRFVEALQNSNVIFMAQFSFQKRTSFSSVTMTPTFPSVPPPESLETEASRWILRMSPQLEVRPCDPAVYKKQKSATKQCIWMRYRVPVDQNDSKLSHSTLAYMSDICMGDTGTIFFPKGTKINLLTSMDHSLWLHRDRFDVNEWILYEQECSAYSRNRSIIHGRLWSRDGRLLMSTSQEALVYTDGNGPGAPASKL